jgi:class 3 adenylate cyclase/predicted metal-dependent HD superfamily phosphohydrolase
MEDISNLDKIKSTFKKYVSKQIVDQILQNENSLNLGGQELEVTTLFSDIRGFTSMSERMSAIDVVASLNEYFDKMIEVVFKYNGTLDKIIGDALMVIYGAPIGSHDDAERALSTAIEMQQKLAELNLERVNRGQDSLEIGIGLNTGKVISGNIGSKEQMNYTVIGDAVNLSARLCSYAKAGQIIVSENVYQALKHNAAFAFKELEPIQVKGKSNKIQVYDVKYFKNNLVSSIDQKYHQIEEFLLSNLPDHLYYHNIDHIRDVVDKVQLHGKNEGLNEEQMHLLITAAWLHDIGYIWDETNHEHRGAQFAREYLPSWGFTETNIEIVCGMIMATKIPQSPKNLMEEVICDADLDYLGRDDYFIVSRRFFRELNYVTPFSEEQWESLQIGFFENHHYFTHSANRLRATGKKNNLNTIQSTK